ncbi:MAG TPA: VOC family protein [Flavobacteriales bacterium]|nr:VOC family protein [Flavobacteriales bacterium]
MSYIISGIQQMGVGVPNVEAIWKWYRKWFGNDVKIFEEAAEAPLMIDYTGNKVHARTATLAINMNGGGGFEIWQYTSRNTEKANFEIQLGDLGLYACRMKCRTVEAHFNAMKNAGEKIIGALNTAPDGSKHFFVQDPNGNIFNVVEGNDWFMESGHACGGVAGAMVGVSDIDKARIVYSEILGYDKVVYDKTGNFEDLNGLPSGNLKYRRVLLTNSKPHQGPFSPLLGDSKIELVQAMDRTPRKIFENRFWGDWGFIHLCFDIRRMSELRKTCEAKGFKFTVDSGNTFDMGEAGGHFSYIEDPDGTLIEFVETHKIPIMKKIGWYLNLKKRADDKPLPRFMLKALRFARKKD